tara:strand:- start:97 stop:417 length:321 start_codon:yes stop_codon:yes gene_type:complete
MLEEISVLELNEKIKNEDDFILLDVRNMHEVVFSKIDGSIHIPMNEIPNRLSEIDSSKDIIVQCKSGKRSARVCEYLLQENYKNVWNLKGGIIAWSNEIDPTIQVY